jgi:SPP1 family predicted phage head-tail adaptor
MAVDFSKMRCRVEIWHNTLTKNDLKEMSKVPTKLFTVWAEIIPQTGKLQNAQADTILSKVTHKIIIRYTTGIENDMWIVYKGHKFNISYILNPYFRNESLEIFAEEVIE